MVTLLNIAWIPVTPTLAQNNPDFICPQAVIKFRRAHWVGSFLGSPHLQVTSFEQSGRETDRVSYLEVGTLPEALQRLSVLAGSAEGQAEVLRLVPHCQFHLGADVLVRRTERECLWCVDRTWF